MLLTKVHCVDGRNVASQALHDESGHLVANIAVQCVSDKHKLHLFTRRLPTHV